MLCESGFLFRMLEDAKGINCQASNFSRAFSATPQGKKPAEFLGFEANLPWYSACAGALRVRERGEEERLRCSDPEVQSVVYE